MARKNDFTAALEAASAAGQTVKPAGKTDDLAEQFPALRAMQGSLQAIRDLNPDLIDDWGAADRLDEEFTHVNSDEADTIGEEFQALKDSIQEFGQQVPILVRQSKKDKGRFEVIYGRRRLRACKELQQDVRANVQNVDDETALLAKSLENSARRPLSFYEKVRFAAAIIADGNDTGTVMRLLSVTKSGASHLKKVSDNVPNQVGLLIGSAPKSGRPRWRALAEAFERKALTETSAIQFLNNLDPAAGSDERLELLLKEVSKRGAQPRETRTANPVDGVIIKSGRGSINVSIKKSGANAGFAKWLDGHLEDLIKESYERFENESAKEK